VIPVSGPVGEISQGCLLCGAYVLPYLVGDADMTSPTGHCEKGNINPEFSKCFEAKGLNRTIYDNSETSTE